MVETFNDPAMIRFRRADPRDLGQFSVIVRNEGDDFVIEQAVHGNTGELSWSYPAPPLWYILQAPDGGGGLAPQLVTHLLMDSAEGELRTLSFMLEVLQDPVSGPPGEEVDEFLIANGKLPGGDLVGHQVVTGAFVVRRFVPPQESLSYGVALPAYPELGEDGLLRVQRVYLLNRSGEPSPLISGANARSDLFGPDRWLEIMDLSVLSDEQIIDLAVSRSLIDAPANHRDFDIDEIRDALNLQGQYQVGPSLTTGELGGLWEYLFQDGGLSGILAKFMAPVVMQFRSKCPGGIPNGTPIPVLLDDGMGGSQGILKLWLRLSLFSSSI